MLYSVSKLRMLVDTALEAQPAVRLVPFDLWDMSDPTCNCPLGLAFNDQYPPDGGGHLTDAQAAAVAMGFDGVSGESMEEVRTRVPKHLRNYFELGLSYRQHPRFTENPYLQRPRFTENP